MSARRVIMTKVPFNFRWPGASIVSCVRELGETLLKGEIADAAVAQGYATEIGATKAGEGVKPVANVTAADPRPTARVDREDLALHDSAGDEPAVDDAG